MLMSYISSLNQDPSPTLFSEESLGQELNTWATIPLYFEDPPLIQSFHLGSDTSDSDFLETPKTDFQILEDDYLYPLVPVMDKHGLPIVSALPVDGPTVISINNASAPRSSTSRLSEAYSTTDKVKLKSRKRKVVEGENDSEKVAQDEDKRRRNTMASARFRQRKKVREAALEIQAKEMTEKVVSLQETVDSLENEAKWLRSLLVEKGDPSVLEIDEDR
jgi:hypothetical protein